MVPASRFRLCLTRFLYQAHLEGTQRSREGSLKSCIPRLLRRRPSDTLRSPLHTLRSGRAGLRTLSAPLPSLRGSNALIVMGEPIQPLNSVDDGWDAVECTRLEAADKRYHDAPGGPHVPTGIHASGGPGQFSLLNALNLPYHNGESSNASS